MWFWQRGDAPEKNQADAKQNTACWDKTSERPSQFHPISPLKWCHWSGGDVPVFGGRGAPLLSWSYPVKSFQRDSQRRQPDKHSSLSHLYRSIFFFCLFPSVPPTTCVWVSQRYLKHKFSTWAHWEQLSVFISIIQHSNHLEKITDLMSLI